MSEASGVTVRLVEPRDREQWAAMRAALWPESPYEEHLREIDVMLSGAPFSTLPTATFVSLGANGALTGFLEAGLRSHADGCGALHPVGYVEGWFVREEFRQRGSGRALLRAAEDWARAQGCREMASDALASNEPSHRAHRALGFEVVDWCLNFRKPL
jgi:aminoglycoside 6'-N-acetyltransferase I